MAWKSYILKVDVLQKHFQFLHTKIKFEGEEDYIFKLIYACPIEDGRKELWHELYNSTKQIQQSWMLGGL